MRYSNVTYFEGIFQVNPKLEVKVKLLADRSSPLKLPIKLYFSLPQLPLPVFYALQINRLAFYSTSKIK